MEQYQYETILVFLIFLGFIVFLSGRELAKPICEREVSLLTVKELKQCLKD